MPVTHEDIFREQVKQGAKLDGITQQLIEHKERTEVVRQGITKRLQKHTEDIYELQKIDIKQAALRTGLFTGFIVVWSLIMFFRDPLVVWFVGK